MAQLAQQIWRRTLIYANLKEYRNDRIMGEKLRIFVVKPIFQYSIISFFFALFEY